MTEEIWKPIKGYEGYYEISNLGRVKSVERYVKQGSYMRHVKESFKKIGTDPYGYPRVTLCKNKVSKYIQLHILLAKAFIPNPENKPQVDHINAIKSDYRIDNLRWVTPKENSNNPNTLKHCRENTYIKETSLKANRTKAKKGTKTAPRTVFQYTLKGEFIKSYSSSNEAHRETGVQSSVIRNACNGIAYSAGGYLWAYTNIPPKYSKPRHNSCKKVIKMSPSFEFIKEYESLIDAAKDNNIIASNIPRSIRRGFLCGGFRWKYKETDARAGDISGEV